MFSINWLNNIDELQIASFIKHITGDDGTETTSKNLKLRAFSKGAAPQIVNSLKQIGGTYCEPSGKLSIAFLSISL